MQTSLIHQIKYLFVKELRSEWKNRYALLSILLLLLISVFIVYTIDQVAPNRVWHSYFYLILLFGIVQNISRSFLGEKGGVHLYYKVMVNHQAVLLSKMAYQFSINILFVGLLFVLLNFFLPQQIPHLGAYLVTALLFTCCNVAIFTFNTAIAMGAKNSAMTASVLSFPLLIPALMISLKAASKCLMPAIEVRFIQDWSILFLLLVITVSLSVLLFRFIWSD